MKKIRRIVIIGCFLLLVTLNLVNVVEATNGVFDLRGEKEVLTPLKTQWEFYWEALLEPEDFDAGAPEPSGYVQVPGAWKGYRLNGDTLTGNGYATYRLKVLMDTDRITAFKIPRIITAYRMWVDGEEVAAAGTVGTSPRESKPQYLTQQAFAMPEQETVEIVIQVSNFHHRSGGILEDLLVGSAGQVLSATKNRLAYELFLFGSLLVMGVYHLVLFHYRKKERSLFYYALFCLVIGIRTLLVGEIFLTQVFPFFNWELGHKLQTLSYYGGVLTLMLFFREMYTQYVSVVAVKASTLVVGLFGAVVLLTPARIFTVINPAFQVFTILLSLYIFVILFRIGKQKENGALFIG
ncbi:MAG: 7TM-DISM domain-containing protein, partial [Firmicutes bacterium]|nr:7TM-DISM domain-containing protein [Bacillota bacterium]